MNPNTFEPEPTGAHRFGTWLTVQEAVAYCASKGLNRTAKTIRKWAHRSNADPGGADLTVRCEDVENGFRWSIELDSLDRKVSQELEFEARRGSEHEETGPNLPEPVQVTSEAETVGHQSDLSGNLDNPGAHLSKPGGDGPGYVEQLNERIADLQEEVAFYREELRDRRNATTALTDVIETFRLTALNNSEARRLRPTSHHDVRTDQSTGEGGGAHDMRVVE